MALELNVCVGWETVQVWLDYEICQCFLYHGDNSN